MKKLLAVMLSFLLILSSFSVASFAIDGAVAKVGNTEYTTIDEAIPAWTNGTTLTLLDNVTLSDVVELKSTEHHILNLGSYTITAASSKDAFVIKAFGTGSAERSALTINADATNPGGIDAGKKRVIYYKYADGGISTEDRPIIKINNGVFTGATSSFGTCGIQTIGTAARKCATLNIAGGIFNCSIYGQSKSKLIISGGTFNYSVGSQGDSTCLRLISGGTFKSFGFMTADSNNTKFWIGTSMGTSNVGTYIDDNGYLVVGGPIITEPGDKFEASSTYLTGWSSYLQYSSAKDNGLYYTSVEEALADNNKSSGNVTVYVDELDMSAYTTYAGTIIAPEGKTLTIKNAPEGLKTEGDVIIVKPVAKIGDTYYDTLEEAMAAAQAGDTVTIFEGTYAVPAMKAGITVVGEGNVLLEGTLSGTLENLTLKNLHIKGSNAQRWAYAKGDLVFENVTFEATSVYALHFDGIADGTNLLYKDCTIIGWAAMGGSPASCVVDGCTIKGNGSYGVIRTYFDATIKDCTFDVADVNPDDVYQDGIHSVDATVTVENTTNVNGDILDTSGNGYVDLDGELIHYHDWTQGETVAPDFGVEGYTLFTCPCGTEEKRDVQPAKVAAAQVGETIYETLADAFAAANDGDTIKVLGDIELNETIKNTKKVTLDLNGKTITGTDNNTSGNFYLINNVGELTITGNGKITLEAVNNRNWNASSVVVANNPGGKLVVENGTIEHLGGTNMAYGIDNLTNGKGTYAETVINGGTIKSTYSGIRQFLNGVEAQNILTVNGGTVMSDNRAIFFQDPSKNANSGTLTITDNAKIYGKVHLSVTEGSTEWPVEVSVAAAALQGESAVTNNYLPAGYVVEEIDGSYTINKYLIMVTYPIGDPVYPEGKVEYYNDMRQAVPHTSNCPRLEGATITLLGDMSGLGMRFMENGMVFDLNGYTYTLTGGTGSKGTETSGFQIRPEVTETATIKNGTIKIAEGVNICWMFNSYATNFVVEDVVIDCTNINWDYGTSCYALVSRAEDNVEFVGNTTIVGFNSDVAGSAINVGDTMTIGENVNLNGTTVELDADATLTAPANLKVVTVDGYVVVYKDGVYSSVVEEVEPTLDTKLYYVKGFKPAGSDETRYGFLMTIGIDSLDYKNDGCGFYLTVGGVTKKFIIENGVVWENLTVELPDKTDYITPEEFGEGNRFIMNHTVYCTDSELTALADMEVLVQGFVTTFDGVEIKTDVFSCGKLVD